MAVNVGNNPADILLTLETIPVSGYLSRPWWLVLTGPPDMDRSVSRLVERLGIPPEDLLLPCTFCATFLTEEDRLRFDFSGYNLIWRRGNAHGICTPCARVCAALEQIRFYSSEALHAEEVLEKEQKPLNEVQVRCRVCLKPLTLTEKLGAAERGEQFVRVRGVWRARCRLCKRVD